ncbi:MAG: hypothetical protein PHN75_11805 [Syntrophales bacterium]|nr:hypothetical protein [Syntrophales bacterium]
MRRKVVFPVLLTSLIFMACGHTLVHPDRAKIVPPDRIYYHPKQIDDQQLAKCIFVRDSQIQGNMVNAHLFLNGIHAAAIDVGERVDFLLEPKKYIIAVKPTDIIGGMTAGNIISHNVEAGNTYYFHIFFGPPWSVLPVNTGH